VRFLQKGHDLKILLTLDLSTVARKIGQKTRGVVRSPMDSRVRGNSKSDRQRGNVDLSHERIVCARQWRMNVNSNSGGRNFEFGG
jgi:hypothetical protein